MATRDLTLILKAKDEASSVMGRVADTAGGMVDTLGKIGLAAIGVKAVAGAVTGLATSLTAGNAEFERYTVQFGVLLKSTDKAKERLAMLAEFGAKTPFELPELVRADKVLTAFGLHSETTAKVFGVSGEQILKTIGDVASGTGVSFEELSVTFGKFASGATGEAIARFQELGIATREQMAGWGLSFSKTGQLLTPAAEAFTILEKHVRDKFGGMMDAQSNTFEGMASNLSDWFGQAQRTVMAPLFDVLKTSLGGLLAMLNSPEAQAAITSISTGLAGGIQSVITAVPQLISTIDGLIIKGLDFLGLGASEWASSGWEALVTTVTQILPEALGNLANIARNATFQSIWNTLLEGARQVKGQLEPIIAGWAQALVAWVQPMVAPMLAELNNLAAQLWGWILAQATPLLDKLLAWANQFAAWIGPAAQQFLKEWPTILDTLLGQVEEAAGPLLEKLGEWAIAFVEWIVPLLPDILKTLGLVVAGILVFLAETALVIGERLVMHWLPAFLTWIVEKLIPALGTELGKVLVRLIDWLTSEVVPAVQREAPGIGDAIIRGIGQGLDAGWNWLKDKVSNLANSLFEAAKDALGIGSPSKVFFTVGEAIIDGIIAGLQSRNTSFIDAITGALRGSVSLVEDLMDRLRPAFTSSFLGGEIFEGFPDWMTDTLDQLKSQLAEAELAQQLASMASVLASLGQGMSPQLQAILQMVAGTATPGGILDTVIKQILAGVIPGFGATAGATAGQGVGPNGVTYVYAPVYNGVTPPSFEAEFASMQAWANV